MKPAVSQSNIYPTLPKISDPYETIRIIGADLRCCDTLALAAIGCIIVFFMQSLKFKRPALCFVHTQHIRVT